jgi:DNA-binding NarL/FixJ family response regulator
MKKSCVLLADSHQNLMEGIRGLLETMFDAVMMVADETSLMMAIDKLTPDIVVVDLSMRASEEANIVHRVRKHNKELKFIVLSVYDDPTVAEEVVTAGASGFVLKRSVVNDLIPAVCEVIEGRSFISPSIEALR